jgi:O-antigen/teichoic acid export membrane protein
MDKLTSNKRPSLLTNFSWALAGNIIYASSQWGMLIALAKIGSTEFVGRFALGLAITAPVITFAKFDLRTIQATDVKGEYIFEDYLKLRIISCVIALLVIMLISYIGNYSRDTLIIIFMISIAKIVESICDIFHGFLQRIEHIKSIAISYMIKGPLSLIAISIGLYIRGLELGVLLMMLAWIIVFIAYDLRVSIRALRLFSEKAGMNAVIKKRFKIIIKLFWLTLPMGVGTLLVSLEDNIPKLFIEHKLGDIQLGYFAAIAYIQVAGTTVVRALCYSAAPRLAHAYAKPGHTGFIMLLWKITLVGFLLGLIGLSISLVLGKQVLTLLYNAEYAKYSKIFSWLMAASMMHFMAMFLSNGLVVIRRFRSSMIIEFVVLITIITGCYFLIPMYGILGAAWAIGVGTSIHAIGALLVIIFVIYKVPSYKNILNRKSISQST